MDGVDHERFQAIFLAAAELDVPLYIHPGVPPRAVRDASYSGFGPMTDLMLATGGWGWHAEAGLAALRVILAGTFDRHPNLQLILGHMGEMLVSFADRADALTKTTHLQRSVLDCILRPRENPKTSHLRNAAEIRIDSPADVRVLTWTEYITGNIYATPGGLFSHRMLRQVLDILGPDRVIFAVDDPYNGALGQHGEEAPRPGFCRDFIETAPIGAEEKSKLAHLNAERLLLARR